MKSPISARRFEANTQLRRQFNRLPWYGRVLVVVALMVAGSLLWQERPEISDAPLNPSPTVGVGELAEVLSDRSRLYAVARIVDGDTIRVDIDGQERVVRLIGVDTPEVVDPRKPVQCYGREASKQVAAWLEGQQVRLETDDSQGSLDRYNRVLAYVYTSDGQMVNGRLIAEGYAFEYTYDQPYRYQAEFKRLEQQARQAERGLWGEAC